MTEPEFKRDWINTHDQADEIICEQSSGKIVAAVYYYAPTHHEAEQKKIWKAIGVSMEIEKLEAMEDQS